MIIGISQALSSITHPGYLHNLGSNLDTIIETEMHETLQDHHISKGYVRISKR